MVFVGVGDNHFGRELSVHNKSYSSKFIVSASLNALKLGLVVNK